MNYRYEKTSRPHTFLKVPCGSGLVGNKLVSGKIVEHPEEEPLVMPTMNFGGEEKTSSKSRPKKVDNKEEEPLEVPAW